MYREMRRKDRKTTSEDAMALLEKGEYGILATSDSSNAPYAVPVSYVFFNDCIYFHCALEGHKLDNIKSNSKVSFCVVGNTKVLPEKFSTAYQSTIVFGIAHIVENTEEKNMALYKILEKYSPDFLQSGSEYIKKAADKTYVVKIDINHISGKQRIE